MAAQAEALVELEATNLREAVLLARLESAEQLIAALANALYKATGKMVCGSCHRVRSTAHCPSCTGVEGRRGP